MRSVSRLTQRGQGSMAQHRSVVLREVVDPPCIRVPSIPVGLVPAGRGTPLLYGLVEPDGRPEWRIDVYGDPGEETHFRSAAVPWAGGVALGRVTISTGVF